MALNSIIIILSGLVLLCMASLVSSHNKRYTPPNVTRVTDMFGHVSIDQAFNKLYGASNIVLSNNASSVSISLDKNTGAGLVSRNKYEYGFFSAAIKLPAGLTSGVVLAFYLSNAETYPHNHDEIDIELLGHDKRRDWAFQTNVYANGSVRTGREEKFYLWFDPTEQYHYYSIFWNTHHIVFFVDNVPVREFPSKIASVYPSKPMSVYATIWDGSEWATHGGKYPVNYEYAPFVARFAEMEVVGCVADPKQPASSCASKASTTSGSVGGPEFAVLSKQQSSAMAWARSKLMFYSYCKDTVRYKVLPPECN